MPRDYIQMDELQADPAIIWRVRRSIPVMARVMFSQALRLKNLVWTRINPMTP